MTKKQDRTINDPFASLNKNQQTLITLDFEGNHSNKEIAPLIGLKNETTVSHWRKKPWYEPAFNAYAVKAVKGGFELSFYGGLKMHDLGGLRINRC